MLEIDYYVIDAFNKIQFKGNPAGVCVLKRWIDEKLMQKIAFENNLSATAFILKKAENFEIKWFTPTQEIDLCGHATLAAAYTIFDYYKPVDNRLCFYSHKSGNLTVVKDNEWFKLLFPADKPIKTTEITSFKPVINRLPVEVYIGKIATMLVFENQLIIEKAVPNFEAIEKLTSEAVIITAKGNEVDFVSRFFAPKLGIFEDPVTGGAHTLLTPFWADKLNKNKLSARQISNREGELYCKNVGKMVEISGQGILYLKGKIYV